MIKKLYFFGFYWIVDHALILLIHNNGFLCFFERLICKAENPLQKLTFQIAKSAFSWSALNALIYSRATIKWKSDNKVKEENNISNFRFKILFYMGYKKLQEPKCRNSSFTMTSIKSLSHRVGSHGSVIIINLSIFKSCSFWPRKVYCAKQKSAGLIDLNSYEK